MVCICHLVHPCIVGAVLGTSQGMVILRSLPVSHPVCRVVVRGAVTHQRAVGDGVKTLLLLLEHSLHAIQDIIDRRTTTPHQPTCTLQQGNNHFCNKIASALETFSNTILSELFTEVEHRAEVLDGDHCQGVLKDKMFAVLLTTISTHLSSSISEFFASLLIDSLILETELQDLESTKEKLEFILTNFELLHVKSLGWSYKESSTVRGFLLERDFLFLSDHHSEVKMKCVLLKCPIEGVLSDDNTTLTLKSEDTLKSAIALHEKKAKLFLQTLRSHKVTLIISTEKMPDYILSLCRTFDISVICCVDTDDIQFLERVSGKCVVHNTWDVVDDRVIISLAKCCRLCVGSRVYVQLALEKVLPKSLILCAPTEGMCHQLADIVYKGFKSVLVCFQNMSISHSGGVTDTSVKTVNPFCSKMLLLDNSSALDDSTVARRGVSLDDDDSCIMSREVLLDDKNTCTMSDGILMNNSDGVKKFHNIVRHSEDTLKFVTFPGGGYFEYVLAQLLEQKMKVSYSDEIIWCCQILAKSLTSVPYALHKNLFHNANARSFLMKDAEVRCALKNNCVAGFNSRGYVCDPVKENILEPPFAKMAIVNNVIQLLVQLLKIDGIVSAKTVQDVSGSLSLTSQ